MWVDAAEKGRQTNWKYVILLFVLALTAAFCGWALEQPRINLSVGQENVAAGTWVSAPCEKDTEGFLVGESLYLLTDRVLTVLDRDLQEISSLEETDMLRFASGDFAAAYVPLGKHVSVLYEQGMKTAHVPGGVDKVLVGKDHFAVLTAGSGCLTKTLIFQRNGEVSGQIIGRDFATVSCVFLPGDNGVAALNYSTDGNWYLEGYTTSGTVLFTQPVEAEICREIRTVGDQILVCTQEEVLFYRQDGTFLSRFSFGTGDLVAWETREKGLVALVTKSRGCYRLYSLSETGERLGEAVLPMEIRDLEVSGNRLYVLDYQYLRVYDAYCGLESLLEDGARAVSIAANEKKVWLLGCGEIMELIHS